MSDPAKLIEEAIVNNQETIALVAAIEQNSKNMAAEIERLTAEVVDAAKWIAAADAEMDRMRDEAALAISLAKADAARLRCMCVELDHLSLVILSAVRQQDPRNYEAVAALIQDNRAALAKEATHGQ